MASIMNWNGTSDPDNPFNWTRTRKWTVTLLACFMTFAVQINGTAMTSAAEHINESFHISDENFPHSYWPVFSWTLSGAAAPMLGLPLMEHFGVRWSYLIIYGCLIIFLIPQALAQNFATLIVTRIITGGASATLANITGGILSDIWRDGSTWKDGKAKSFGTSLFIWGILAGLSMGPVTGSVTLHYTTWRWIFYSEIIAYSALVPVLYYGLPEVRPDVILTRRAHKMHQTHDSNNDNGANKQHVNLMEIIRETLIRPSRMLCTEAVVFFFGMWSAFCIGTAFMFTQSIGQVYSERFDWTYYGTGLVQSALVIGEVIGVLTSLLQDELYFRSARRNTEIEGTPIPEARLYFSIPASFIGLSGGLFYFAWTTYSSIPWIVPSIALGFVGFGMFTSVTAVTNYIIDAYGKYSASAIAGVAFLENVLAAFLPLATQSMYRTLGFQWASSLLGFLALALSFVPVVLFLYGRGIRERSPFMSETAYDKEMA